MKRENNARADHRKNAHDPKKEDQFILWVRPHF